MYYWLCHVNSASSTNPPSSPLRVHRELETIASTSDRLPSLARQALAPLVREFEDLDLRIMELERDILAIAKTDDVCRRLMTIPGVGPFIAAALSTPIPNPGAFASGRCLAAWLGLIPRRYSTGGKSTLGRISKRGDGYIRTHLIHGERGSPAPLEGYWFHLRAPNGQR